MKTVACVRNVTTLDDVFEGLSQEFSSFFCDGGVVEELSERCFFACSLDGSIVIECLCEEVDFVVALSDVGRGSFGGSGTIFTKHSK
ncbi:MAG: hypothetical protein FWE95_09965 [Planctomycetaceae bacterium]|nr:hypothetical protein [Planctomycetaceae bacterium]